DVVPDLLIIGVEDMRAIDMHHHAGLGVAFGVTIAADMIAAVNDPALMASLGQPASDDSSGQSGPYQQYVHYSECLFLLAAPIIAAQVSSYWPDGPEWPRPDRRNRSAVHSRERLRYHISGA